MVFMVVAVTLCNFVFQDQTFLVPDEWGTSTQCVWNNLGNYDGASVARLVIWTVIASDSLLCMAAFFWPSTPVIRWYDALRSIFPSVPLLAISWVDQIFLRPAHGKARRLVGFVLQVPLIASFWVVFTVAEIYCSVSFDLFRNYLILFTTTQGIYYFRAEARENYLTESEDKWGFLDLIEDGRTYGVIELPLIRQVGRAGGPCQTMHDQGSMTFWSAVVGWFARAGRNKTVGGKSRLTEGKPLREGGNKQQNKRIADLAVYKTIDRSRLAKCAAQWHVGGEKAWLVGWRLCARARCTLWC